MLRSWFGEIGDFVKGHVLGDQPLVTDVGFILLALQYHSLTLLPFAGDVPVIVSICFSNTNYSKYIIINILSQYLSIILLSSCCFPGLVVLPFKRRCGFRPSPQDSKKPIPCTPSRKGLRAGRLGTTGDDLPFTMWAKHGIMMG